VKKIEAMERVERWVFTLGKEGRHGVVRTNHPEVGLHKITERILMDDSAANHFALHAGVKPEQYVSNLLRDARFIEVSRPQDETIVLRLMER